jgi:hypothetical protein
VYRALRRALMREDEAATGERVRCEVTVEPTTGSINMRTVYLSAAGEVLSIRDGTNSSLGNSLGGIGSYRSTNTGTSYVTSPQS